MIGVAGVFIERNGATLICAASDSSGVPYPNLSFLIVHRIKWNSKNQEEVKRKLSDLCFHIADKCPPIQSLAISSPGPFVSLKRDDSEYSMVHKKYGAKPFRGLNLCKFFTDELTKAKIIELPLISIMTDANAFSVGEAMARDLPPNEALYVILAIEDVGGGLVIGREVFNSALHGEIGLLHTRFINNDPLRPPEGSRLYSRSISELANNDSIRDRFEDLYPDQEFGSVSDPTIWDFRAYYIAQACLAVTAIIPPHQIVLATNLDPLGTFVRSTRAEIQNFWNTRELDERPVQDYAELKNWDTYIDGISPQLSPRLILEPTSIALTGAAGLCLTAAEYWRKYRSAKILKISTNKFKTTMSPES